jgi:hypothetical protein
MLRIYTNNSPRSNMGLFPHFFLSALQCAGSFPWRFGEFGVWNLMLSWNLVLGIWSFSGAWCLVFGVFLACARIDYQRTIAPQMTVFP